MVRCRNEHNNDIKRLDDNNNNRIDWWNIVSNLSYVVCLLMEGMDMSSELTSHASELNSEIKPEANSKVFKSQDIKKEVENGKQ